MKCAGCGCESPSDFAFCPRCGSKLPATCPSCGAACPPEFAFRPLERRRRAPARRLPPITRASLDGRLKLDELITHRLTPGDINAGFEGMERREVTRAVVVLQGARRGPGINRP